jgi:phosphoribosylaminoimidazolecarboxamide formyltransferase/IMP cyclohydrolase
MNRESARVPMRRALLSVSDKTDLVAFAKGLVAFGIEILSTGGTRKELEAAGIEVVDVAEFTGFPEMLDGRVKTLHPMIHGGLLHRRDVPEHLAQIAAQGIKPIDLLVVNLYPFEKVAADPSSSAEKIIENIDIGGPAMIRSAAKNHSHVAVIVDPSQYKPFLAELQKNGGAAGSAHLRSLALAAFQRTAEYDRTISQTLERKFSAEESKFPNRLSFSVVKRQELRYGENPHQTAAVYVDPQFKGRSVLSAEKLHGKELSFNNLLDLDAALAVVSEFDRPAFSVVKHNNPCGAAVADDLATAFRRAWDGDPTSAFGSVIACNRVMDRATAEALVEPGRFVEAIIAPGFEEEAVRLLTTVPTWKNNVRLLRLTLTKEASAAAFELRPIAGGVLMQSRDAGRDDLKSAKVVTSKAPTDSQLLDLAFAWALVRHVRSNAIVLAADQASVGVGAGQMSRVDACRIAIEKSGAKGRGAVLASDAFFPFRDCVDLAASAGVSAIVQPGGSKRDDESIAACNEHGIAMVFTGERRFKH